MLDPLPQPGQIVAGKYRITKVLGEGGMGVVYAAEHVRLGQRVALKMLLPEYLQVDDLVKRFDREARAASQLRSRHTARVTDVDITSEGVPFMVMELLEGRDLDAELGARQKLPLDEAVDYVLQACGAMDEAHALGIVHRDLKPSNVFLSEERGGRIAKILDFGISKITNDGEVKLTSAEAVMGTAMYMAPEQVRASHAVDARADIWSLGVVLYELVSGRAPFVGTPTQVAAAIVTEDPPPLSTLLPVPAGVATALARCLARNPNDRFASVRELMAALLPFAPKTSQGAITAQQLLGTQPHHVDSSTLDPSSVSTGHAKTVVAWGAPVPKRTSRTTLIGLASIVAVVLLLGFIGFRLSSRPSPGPPSTPDLRPAVAAPARIEVPTSTPSAVASTVATPTKLAESPPPSPPASAAHTPTKPQSAPSPSPRPVPSGVVHPPAPPLPGPAPTADPPHI